MLGFGCVGGLACCSEGSLLIWLDCKRKVGCNVEVQLKSCLELELELVRGERK